MFDKGPDGHPQTTPALQGMRDGFEDFAYWRQFDLMLARATELDAAKLSKKDFATLCGAQQFHQSVFDMSDNSPIPMHLNSSAPRPGPTVDDTKVDRWQLLAAKADLLRQMLALQVLLPDAKTD